MTGWIRRIQPAIAIATAAWRKRFVKQYGRYGEGRCPRCGKKSDGQSLTCAACLVKVKAWRSANPERVKQTSRKSTAKKYAASVDALDSLLKAQNGVCAICRGQSKNMVKGGGKQRALAIDHDHKTNRVRGFLCGQCNTALGKFMDDPRLLVRAAGYVSGRLIPQFTDLAADMVALNAKKGLDYGSDHDPFANVRASAEFGVAPWVGGLVRLNDKVTRLKTFARKGVLANESAEDSMLDIAVYSLIILSLYREQTAKTS